MEIKEIIDETFERMGQKEYVEMAKEMTLYHHEKWNGKGYPEGLKQEEIPLCARIMTIADVFDAVSANRCYRKVLPLETCFEIIEKGRSEDFDPLLTDIFLRSKDQILKIINQ